MKPPTFVAVRRCASAAHSMAFDAASSACPFNHVTVKKAPLSAVKIESAVKSFEHVPSPRHWPIFGTTFALMRAGGAPYVHLYTDMRHKTLGPIYKVRVKRSRVRLTKEVPGPGAVRSDRVCVRRGQRVDAKSLPKRGK